MSFPSDKIADGDPGYNDPKRRESFAAKIQRQLSVTSLNDDESTTEGQLFSMIDVDPALDAKMHIVNNVCALRLLLSLISLADSVLGDR